MSARPDPIPPLHYRLRAAGLLSNQRVWDVLRCGWTQECGCEWKCESFEFCWQNNQPVTYSLWTYVSTPTLDDEDVPILLYVGSTKNIHKRFHQHSKDKHWWKRVSGAQIKAYASRSDAFSAEKRLIETHRPLMNIQWNGRDR